MWQELKRDQILGFDFHRQKPIDKYILDFFCHELELGIEVDGFTHENAEAKRKDRIKEKGINGFGITVLRFTDEQVLNDMDYVLETIRAWIYLHTSHTPGPSQEGKNAGAQEMV